MSVATKLPPSVCLISRVTRAVHKHCYHISLTPPQTESTMWAMKVLCLASILVQVMSKLILVFFAKYQLNHQVSPLPVESSLPPINWDNIKAKWAFVTCHLHPPLTLCLPRYPTVAPWTPGSKLPPGFLSADSLGPPGPVPHPGYKKGTKR